MSTFEEYEIEIQEVDKTLYKPNIEHKKKSREQRFKDFLLAYGEKIILIVGIVLIASASFEAGFLRGQKNQKGPIEIKLASDSATSSVSQINNNLPQNQASITPDNDKAAPATENQKCAFVGSKNSNKYHLPTCVWAQRIKPENRVCFSSKEDAEGRGYQPAKDCIK